MRNKLLHAVFVSGIVCASAGVACTANIHDNTVTIPNASVTFNSQGDVSNVPPGQAVAVSASAQNVYLIEPSATPPPEHAADAGHFQVYLDDVDSMPLVITAQTMFSVMIPASTPAGHHKVICRVHKHDGTPTSVEAEIDVNVAVSVMIGTGDAGTPPVDAGTPSGDGGHN